MCVCIFVCVCVCVCVYVCVCEKERESVCDRECVFLTIQINSHLCTGIGLLKQE
jgi:hypothetical protein